MLCNPDILQEYVGGIEVSTDEVMSSRPCTEEFVQYWDCAALLDMDEDVLMATRDAL